MDVMWCDILMTGAVKMLLDRVNKEDNIRVDEIAVKFPLNSTDEVQQTFLKYHYFDE